MNLALLHVHSRSRTHPIGSIDDLAVIRDETFGPVLAFAKLRSRSAGIGGKIAALFTLNGALPKRMKGK